MPSKIPDPQSKAAVPAQRTKKTAAAPSVSPENAGRKKLFKGGAALLALAFVGWGIFWLFAPYKGGMGFGVCRVFLELNVRYPHELRLTGVHDFGRSFRIWYTQMDAFGQSRMETIQCFYKMDPQLGLQIETVEINRRPVDQALVDKFNPSIPTIYAHPPNLTYPTGFQDKLKGFEVDTDLFRKPIL